MVDGESPAARLRFTLLEAGPPHRGRLVTRHGAIETPAFISIATQAAAPYLGPDDLAAAGCPMLMVNALFVALRPGVDIVSKAGGGLHGFMGWDRPIVTASGSYQLRMGQPDGNAPVARKIDDDGATVISHVDGSRHRWTPETCIDVQARLGADVALALSQQTGIGEDADDVRRAVDRSLRWNERSLAALTRMSCQVMEPSSANRQDGSSNEDSDARHVPKLPDHVPALFGVAQGGGSPDERRRCARALAAMPFDGYAVGGRFGDADGARAHDALAAALDALPAVRPRHVLIARDLSDVLWAFRAGADLVSAAFPTRLAQRGILLTEDGQLFLGDDSFAHDRSRPIDGCDCPLCTTFSRAYLHHLYHTNEMLGPRLLGIHNLTTVQRAVAALRADEPVP